MGVEMAALDVLPPHKGGQMKQEESYRLAKEVGVQPRTTLARNLEVLEAPGNKGAEGFAETLVFSAQSTS